MSGYSTTETVTLKNTFNALWLDGLEVKMNSGMN
jgi:hypothetical protein